MFSNNSFAKVWEIQPRKEGSKALSVKITTSYKDKKSGKYNTDFNGYVYLVSKALDVAEKENLQSGDKIKILSCGVRRVWNKEKSTNNETFTIFDMEIASDRKKEPTYDGADEFIQLPDDDELPFATED